MIGLPHLCAGFEQTAWYVIETVSKTSAEAASLKAAAVCLSALVSQLADAQHLEVRQKLTLCVVIDDKTKKVVFGVSFKGASMVHSRRCSQPSRMAARL